MGVTLHIPIVEGAALQAPTLGIGRRPQGGLSRVMLRGGARSGRHGAMFTGHGGAPHQRCAHVHFAPMLPGASVSDWRDTGQDHYRGYRGGEGMPLTVSSL